jgi:hypothetical protein
VTVEVVAFAADRGLWTADGFHPFHPLNPLTVFYIS